MRRNGHRRKTKHYSTLRIISILLVSILSCPSNYSGKTLNPGISAYQLPFHGKLPSVGSTQTKGSTNDDSAHLADLSVVSIGVCDKFLAFSSLCLFISTLLLAMIWRYFNSIPISFQCTLSSLYQDIVAIAISTNWVWYGIIFASYLNGQDLFLAPRQAKLASFMIITLECELMLVLNAISAIWLYTIKEAVLDPPVPWGLDEKGSLITIRCTCITFGTGFVTLLYLAGFYPKIDFILSGDLRAVTELPNGPNIFTTFLGILSIIPISSATISFGYKRKFHQQMSKTKNAIFVLMILTFVTALVIGHTCSVFSTPFDAGDFLVIGQLLVVASSVGVPGILILRKNALRACVGRQIQGFAFHVKSFIESCLRCISYRHLDCHRSRQISPQI